MEVNDNDNMNGGEMEWSGGSPFVTGGSLAETISSAKTNWASVGDSYPGRLVVLARLLSEAIIVVGVVLLFLAVWLSNDFQTNTVQLLSGLLAGAVLSLNAMSLTEKLTSGSNGRNYVAEAVSGVVPLVVGALYGTIVAAVKA